MLVQTVIDDQVICHSYTVRLHRMSNAVIIITDLGYKEREIEIKRGNTSLYQLYSRKNKKLCYAVIQTFYVKRNLDMHGDMKCNLPKELTTSKTLHFNKGVCPVNVDYSVCVQW